MKPAPLIALGIGCLVAAQALVPFIVKQRQEFTPLQDVYASLTPGEFAGTLMLGGFRGMACDLLWLRADLAKNGGRFYESFALFQAISKIQPRFEQPWQYMSWDLAYNLSHEVNDTEAKWAWIRAGLVTARDGWNRNPQSEKLLRWIAWLFHHKGDLFHDQVEREDWAPFLNPIIERVNQMGREKDPAFVPVELLASGAGNRNYQISARMYECCTALTDVGLMRTAAFTRRFVPLGLESDGNLLRDRGLHRDAVLRYLDSLDAWQRIDAYSKRPADAQGSETDHTFSQDSYERNEGRLRRKVGQLVKTLAVDPAEGDRVAQLVFDRSFSEARTALVAPGAFRRTSVESVRVRWLDQP